MEGVSISNSAREKERISNRESVNNGKKNRLRREIESLHQELEVTGYARGKLGHRQRKVPRDVSKLRTEKRKLLEKLDENELAILGNNDFDGTDDHTSRIKRLRGSKVAIEDSVIQGSLIFSTASPAFLRKNNDKNLENKDSLCNRFENGGKKIVENQIVDNVIEENEDEAKSTELRDIAETKADYEEGEPSKDSRDTTSQRKFSKHGKSNGPSTKKRRKMYRLRNFQSLKMAEKHGSAIAAHARGQQRLAIEQLKEVAKAAPSAPQVYSSLGMVYEDMLQESRKRYKKDTGCSFNTPTLRIIQQIPEKATASGTPEAFDDVCIPHGTLANQRILATKAYGSYHVAAILCKKDFTLWVRAADSALDIAEIHNEVIKIPTLSKKLCEYHRTERRRWQDEALRDYIVADNLKPPGIDVPAKLAVVHMELGNISEALTILTDLKNRAGYDFQCSYRAWMLYSDLMLRLGHECIQWSKGIQTNANYMFRRWLRKFSKTFDWQERRLQGLSLAFEAAAGTGNAKDFLTWIQTRILKSTKFAAQSHFGVLLVENTIKNNQSLSNPQGDVSEAMESKQKLYGNLNPDTADHTKSEGIQPEDEVMNSMKLQLTNEKRLILSNHSRELEAFDKTTTEMNLMPESTAAKERKTLRKFILKKHDAAMIKLEKEYDEKESDTLLQSKESSDEIIGMNTSPLPISGSIRQVCSIASELMKHLLGLELYEGAKLVGNGVSSYMKERARRYHLGNKARKKVDEWQKKILDSPFFLDSYEDNDIVSHESDLTYLSDEEILLNNEEDSSLVKSLSTGPLTPELRVLYGLALIGEGGQNFIAAKCLEAIEDLEQEGEEWFSGNEDETKSTTDPFWLLFRRAMTEELGRTGAYAFTADVLKKTNKEREWAIHFSSLFRSHLETLEGRGLINRLLNLREDHMLNKNFRKNQVLKVVLGACKFDVYTIDERDETNYALNRSPLLTRGTKTRIARTALTKLASLFPSVWSIEDEGVLPTICVEIVKVVAKSILCISSTINDISYSMLKNMFHQCTTIISYLCGSSIQESTDIDEKEAPLLEGAKKFPVKSSWQSAEFRMLSICTYNFAVACNISLFSGWESEEFTMKTLKKRHGQQRHFGIHIGDRRLSGCIPRAAEDELNRQWDLWSKTHPWFPKLDFTRKMKTVKQSEWFRAEIKNRQETLKHNLIATYAEEDALKLFLGYAAICTHLSRCETNERESQRCQQLALSIILPLTQFCLDENLWDSDIGEAAATLASYEEWQLLAGNTEYQPIIDREGLYPKRIRKSGKRVHDKKVREWIEGVGSPTSKDFIPVPNTELKRLWMKTIHPNPNSSENTEAKKQMQKVHNAVGDLRACYTYTAVEKACLSLSIVLLEMAALPGCDDPFNCLQQAASFASQATKSGNSDIVYRQSLPEMTQCSPREALIILGRADCLQAVYFPSEAAYLCSFVARVCRLHRDSREVACEWDDRWKVVAIYAYNVSVMIRITVSNILDQAIQKAFMTAWERDVVEELEKGRIDGRTWMNTLAKKIGDISLGNGSNFNSSSKDIVEGLTELKGNCQENFSVAPDMKLLLKGEQALPDPPDIYSKVQFESEHLNEKVVKLLDTEIDHFHESSNSLNGIIQYSV